MKSLPIVALAAFATLSVPAVAEPITQGVWQLTNNTTHSLGAAGFYRYNGSGYDLYDFETNGADVQMAYDAVGEQISISGQAYDTVGDRLVDIDLTYTDVGVSGNRVSIANSTTVGTFDGVEVMSKGMKDGTLYLDSIGADDLFTGHGWLGTDAGHFGDFHLGGTRVGDLTIATTNPVGGTSNGGGSVPAPGGLALLFAGGAFMLYRRKRSQA